MRHEGGGFTCENLDQSVAEVLEANPPLYLERNLHGMIQLARGMGIEIALLTWAYSPNEFDYPGGDLMTAPFRQAAIAEQNAVIREVAEDGGALLYDLAESMPEEPAYWIDGYHMSARGTAEMARQLADFLANSGALAR